MLELFNEYKKFQERFYNTRKYKFLRPEFTVLSRHKPSVLSGSWFKNENAVLWWRYAFECVKRTIRMRAGS